jgi:hypothetical protein
LKDRNLLQADDIARLNILNVHDIEELCARQRAGVSFFKMLRAWSKNRRFSDETIHNFLLKHYSQKRNYGTLTTYFNKATIDVRNIAFRNVVTPSIDF